MDLSTETSDNSTDDSSSCCAEGVGVFDLGGVLDLSTETSDNSTDGSSCCAEGVGVLDFDFDFDFDFSGSTETSDNSTDDSASGVGVGVLDFDFMSSIEPKSDNSDNWTDSTSGDPWNPSELTTSLSGTATLGIFAGAFIAGLDTDKTSLFTLSEDSSSSDPLPLPPSISLLSSSSNPSISSKSSIYSPGSSPFSSE